MSLRYDHDNIKLESRHFEQLQRFLGKSKKIRSNFMKISEHHDEICKQIELFSVSNFENAKKSTKIC